MQKKNAIFFLTLFCLSVNSLSASTTIDQLDNLSSNVVQQLSLPIEHWRFSRPDTAGQEQPSFDDSSWQDVSPGFTWPGENTKVWFRTKVTIPSTIAGQPVDGRAIRLELGVDDDGELYIDGHLKEAFHWDDGAYTLTQHAVAGQTFNLAIRGINGPVTGQLHFARLYLDALPEFDQYRNEARFLNILAGNLPANERKTVNDALNASEAEIHFTEITSNNLDSARIQLQKALAALSPLATLTRQYDVYYLGHAHIDMNWLWTWPETIDTCRRTWNSAMNMMDEFPEFHFVQSQPGAYVPIEQTYLDEFARMQAMVAKGQWDPVGGLWNESDTDIPSGEGLARSFLLGQTYFKNHFGKYAITGWLPDSFGHTWQLPQIMRLAGINYFYHMRCGNGLPFTWWEAPDGSRVLKANTENYDDTPQLNQLVEPFVNETRYQLPQSLIVFGVGDHGGGPTREQIIKIQSYEKDPVLPHVHFTGANDFFAQLAAQPSAASLPIVDRSLQYTLEGCYSTHADMKKAIRQSENNLYSAEVLSSLAALMGQTYPLKSFQEAWKPTAFAQFHDIACGSAIHSTYDWMHQQLAPAFAFEKQQTETTLSYLNSNVDTRGSSDTPIVVWNTLSFSRDDVVKVSLPDAAQFHSVTDNQGQSFPAQVMDGTNLVFVARNVPALGYAVYFPQTNSCSPDANSLNDLGYAYELQTPALNLRIDKATGAIAQLYSKSANWTVFGHAHEADAMQLLGDSGNAWVLQYTGENKTLAQGAVVYIVDQGPVFDRVRVVHKTDKSTFTQDFIAYGALPRADVPTTIDWQEQHQTLKIPFPVNVKNPEVAAQIPYASAVFPMTGQECSGQKWMDVSQTVPQPVQNATPLDLSSLFNISRIDNFDGTGHSFPANVLPTAGTLNLGFNKVPFIFPASAKSDSVTSAGQEFPLTGSHPGDTLYLLAACVNGSRWTQIGFRLPTGTVENRAFPLNDWVVNAYPPEDDAVGFSSTNWQTAGGTQPISLHMWIVKIPVPKNATALILPHDSDVRLFAATIANKIPDDYAYGLSVLNDCKYGFDVTNGVFRLTALRSSSEPDPQPDQGLQQFTYSLYPHADGWRAAHTDQQALSLNVPLLASAVTPHAPTAVIPQISLDNIGSKENLILTGLKRSEDGRAFILRFYEADGDDTVAKLTFSQAMQVEQTDLLEQTITNKSLTVQGNTVTLPVGHNQIISLRFRPTN